MNPIDDLSEKPVHVPFISANLLFFEKFHLAIYSVCFREVNKGFRSQEDCIWEYEM